LECIFYAWLFGIDKLDILLHASCGERIPTPVKWTTKWFIPIFTLIMIFFSIKAEQDKIVKELGGITTIIQWAGRLLYIVPLLMIPLGSVFTISCPSVYDLIDEQYGIRFNNKKWNDHSYVKDGVTHNEPVVKTAEELVLPFCNSANVSVAKSTALILLILNVLSHGILGTLLSACLDKRGFNWAPISLLVVFVLPVFGWITGVIHMYCIWKNSTD